MCTALFATETHRLIAFGIDGIATHDASFQGLSSLSAKVILMYVMLSHYILDPKDRPER